MSLANILVVDDDAAVRELFEAVLTDVGVNVATAETGDAGLELWRAGNFDAVVSDKNLPGMSGVELLRRIRADSRRVPCFLITAFASEQSAQELLAEGVDGYLVKPFDDVIAIGARIKTAAARHRSSEAAEGRNSPFGAKGPLDAKAAGATVLVVTADDATSDSIDSALMGLAVAARATNLGSLWVGLDSGKYALVILDDRVCDANVVDVVKRLRVSAAGVACVLVHGRTPLHLLIELIDVGVHAAVRHPVDAKELRDRVSGMLRAVSAPASRP